MVYSSYNTASQKGMHALGHHAGNAPKERCSLFLLHACAVFFANIPQLRLERGAAICNETVFISEKIRPKSS